MNDNKNMAKREQYSYIEPFATRMNKGNGQAVDLFRQNQQPIDVSELFTSEADYNLYLDESPVAFPGQVVAVVDQENGVVKVYKTIINADKKTLGKEELGAAKLSENYQKAATWSAPAAGDSLDTAIGKLHKGIEEAQASGVTSVGGKTGAILLDASGEAVGSINLTIDSNNKLKATLVGSFADGAQVNVLEGVQVNGKDLTIDTNKKVNVSAVTGINSYTGAVTLKKGSTTNGDVNFELNNATGEVTAYVQGIKSAAFEEKSYFTIAIDTSYANAEAYTKEYTNAEIGKLSHTSTGAAGKYIQKVSEANGIISETAVAFDTTIGSASTDNNAPTSKAVFTAYTAAETFAEDFTKSYVKEKVTDREGAANGLATLDENSKILLSQIPDVILGQMMLGGTVSWTTDNEGIATISKNLKTKLNITDNTIQLIDSATDDKTQTPKEYGFKTLEGVYFISESSGTVGSTTFEVGDWLVSIGTAWKKIDNTDAVTGVKGSAETNYRIGNVEIKDTDIKTVGDVTINAKFVDEDYKIAYINELHASGTTHGKATVAEEVTSGIANIAEVSKDASNNGVHVWAKTAAGSISYVGVDASALDNQYDTKGAADAAKALAYAYLQGTVGADGWQTIQSAYALAKDAKAHSGVESLGGKTGVITVRGSQETNGAVNLTMSEQELQASIVGLGDAAYQNTTYFDLAGAAATAQANAYSYASAYIDATYTYTIEVILDNEKVVATALNNLDGRINSLNSYVDEIKVSYVAADTALSNRINTLETAGYITKSVSDLENYYTKTSIDSQLASYVMKEAGKGLSTNDFDNNAKTKLDGISTGANKVEASSDNGYILIDGTKTKVFTEVANTVHDADYKHISVTETSVSDGTTTFNKYVHPTTTAVDAAAVKVGKDANGHVVLGTAITAGDVNAYTKAETDERINSYINTLDVTEEGFAASYTLAALGEVDGKITFSKQAIQIAQSQVTGLSDAIAAKVDKSVAEEATSSDKLVKASTVDTKVTAAIEALDNNDAPVAGKYVSYVIETNGIVTSWKEDLPAADEYTIAKETSTTYAAVYRLTKNGTAVGEPINIAKDQVIKAAAVIKYNGTDTTITIDSVVYTVKGTHAKGTYVVMIIQNASEDQIWLDVKDLCDVYKADGKTLQLDASTNTFSAKLDQSEGVTSWTAYTNLKANLEAKDAEIISSYVAADTQVHNDAYTYTSTSVDNAYAKLDAADTAIIDSYTAADAQIVLDYTAADATVQANAYAYVNAEIAKLDADVTSTEGDVFCYVNVKETDGKITDVVVTSNAAALTRAEIEEICS